MDEKEFGDWLRYSLDRQEVPAALADKARTSRSAHSVTWRVMGTVLPTLALLAVAAIVFGIKVLHSTPGAIGPGASPVAQLPSQPPALLSDKGQ